jgi:hypothetical protein
MRDEPDYELVKDPDAPSEPSVLARPPSRWPIVVTLIVIVLSGAALWLSNRRPAPRVPVEHAPAPAVGTDVPVKPLGGAAEAIDVPPLDQSDALVRELVRKLSSHPAIAAWLATDGLIRNFATVVSTVAEGKTPARQVAAVRPPAAFETVARNGRLYIDQQSYARYDGLAAALASLDPAGSARLYATLKPRIEEANRELGLGGTPFDRTLERAIVRLLQTPVVEDPIRVEPLPKTIGYRFADPRLEELSGAQKQLLRMGGRNVRIVKDSLRRIALALGIPAERLP